MSIIDTKIQNELCLDFGADLVFSNFCTYGMIKYDKVGMIIQ